MTLNRFIGPLTTAVTLWATIAHALADAPADPTQSYETVVKARVSSKLTGPDLRLTGKQLAERGAHDLAEALDLLPEVEIRPAGRGGYQIDLRGARKGMVMIIIDGVPVDEPYYGNFDLTSIPITDLVEVRVSLAPASPLDGPGGSGGVIEVVTRAAAGPRRVAARTQADSAGSGNAEFSGRSSVGGNFSMRVSASGENTTRDFDYRDNTGKMNPFSPSGQLAHAAVRLEYISERTRVVGDLWANHRVSDSPPGPDAGGTLLHIDPENAARGSVSAEREVGAWRVGGRAYGDVIHRISDTYSDIAKTTLSAREDLTAGRFGASLHGDHHISPKSLLALRASLDNDYADVLSGVTMPRRTNGLGSVGEIAGGYGYSGKRWRLNADAGFAVPVTGKASPWPEAKLTTTVAPDPVLELQATLGHKGRVPTLREKFALNQGNPDLSPERSSFAEGRVTLKPTRLVNVSGLGFVRYTQGLIHFDPVKNLMANAGQVTVHGVEATLAIAPERDLSGGFTYSYTDWGPAAGDDMVNFDFFPRHRAEAWVSARYHGRGGSTVRVRHESSQTDSVTTLEPATSVDFSAWAKLSHDFTATVRVANVLDQTLPERANVYVPGTSVAVSVEGVWD